MIQTKRLHLEGRTFTVLTAVVGHMLFMFQLEKGSCELFFIFNFRGSSIEHIKLRNEREERKLFMLVVLKGEGGVLMPKLIEVLYEKLVLNMVYEIPGGIKDPQLTNHMSSTFANGQWLLSVDNALYSL